MNGNELDSFGVVGLVITLLVIAVFAWAAVRSAYRRADAAIDALTVDGTRPAPAGANVTAIKPRVVVRYQNLGEQFGECSDERREPRSQAELDAHRLIDGKQPRVFQPVELDGCTPARRAATAGAIRFASKVIAEGRAAHAERLWLKGDRVVLPPPAPFAIGRVIAVHDTTGPVMLSVQCTDANGCEWWTYIPAAGLQHYGIATGGRG